MPRRDGLPTNNELLADFNATAHGIFLQAYEADLADPLPPAYEGKSLAHIRLGIIGVCGAGGPQALVAEEMRIRALSVDMAQSLDTNLRFRNYPPDVLERYKDLAEHLEGVTIIPGLPIRNVLPVEGTDATYVATLVNGRMRHVDTFKEKPTKQTIVTAQFFAEEVHESLRAGQESMPSFDEAIAHVTSSEEKPFIARKFSFDITPDLALNGHEPRDFLMRFYEDMLLCAERRKERLDKLRSLGSAAVKAAMDIELESYQRYNRAVMNAQKALDKQRGY